MPNGVWSGNFPILWQHLRPPDYSPQKLICGNIFAIETKWKTLYTTPFSHSIQTELADHNIPSVQFWYDDKFSSCFSIISKWGVDTTWVFERCSNKIADFSNSWKWLSIFNASWHCSISDAICADSLANSIKQMLIYSKNLHNLQVIHMALRKTEEDSLETIFSAPCS